MNTGKIIKGKTSGNFTVIPNHIFEDKRIGLKEIGLLCFLLKLPPDWTINKSRLHVHLKDGRDAVMGAFDILIKTGYIQKTEIRNKGRFLGFDYVVNETPLFTEEPQKEAPKVVKIAENPKPENPESVAPITENPKPEKPKPEKPDVINKILTKDCNNKISLSFTNVNNKGAGNQKKLFQRFIECYDRWHKEYNDSPPKIDGAQGNAAKSLIGYFKKVVKERFARDNPAEILTAENLDIKVLEAWELVLKSWDQLEPFYQDKTRLIDINSNIQIIIKKIKDGTKPKQPGSKKIDSGGISAMFDAVDSKYGKPAGGY